MNYHLITFHDDFPADVLAWGQTNLEGTVTLIGTIEADGKLFAVYGVTA